MKWCAICKYKKKGPDDEVSFHEFPTDEQRRALWQCAIPKKNFKPKKHTVICSNHFTEDCFHFSPAVRMRKRLVSDAVPTLFNEAKQRVCKCITKKLNSEKNEDRHVDNIITTENVLHSNPVQPDTAWSNTGLKEDSFMKTPTERHETNYITTGSNTDNMEVWKWKVMEKRQSSYIHKYTDKGKTLLQRKYKQTVADPLSTDQVSTVKTTEAPSNDTPIVPGDPLIVQDDPPIIPKEEPVDVDTSNNVPPGFEMVALPGCSTWSDEVTKEPPTLRNARAAVPQPPQKICRLCMSSEDLIGIYDPVSLLQELSSKIIEVCAIPIHEGDGLPQYICQNCMATVQKFYDFRLQCSVTDVTLKAEHTNTVLVGTKRKRKGDSSEFQKLNKRLKANIQSFYDLIDSVNEFQDKVQRQLEDTVTSSKKPTNAHGTKRKTGITSQKRGKTAKSINQLVPVESAIPQTLPDQSSDTQLLGSDEGPSLLTSIKSEPGDPESHVESVFVSSVGADFVTTKLEIDEHIVFDPCAVTDVCETMLLDRDSLVLGQDNVVHRGQFHSQNHAHTNYSVTEESGKEKASDKDVK